MLLNDTIEGERESAAVDQLIEQRVVLKPKNKER